MNTISIIRKYNYAILQLNRGKVNAINHLMVREIRSAIASFHQDSEVKGVILTGIPHFFTAGLDVIELYSYNKEQITAFYAMVVDKLGDDVTLIAGGRFEGT